MFGWLWGRNVDVEPTEDDKRRRHLLLRQIRETKNIKKILRRVPSEKINSRV